MARARRGGSKRPPPKPLPVWSPPSPPLPPEPHQSDSVGRFLGILFLIIVVPFGLSGLLPRSSTSTPSPVSSGTSTYYGSSTASPSGATYNTAALPSGGQTTLYGTPSTPSFEPPPVAEPSHPEPPETLYVSGRKVALRDAPNAKGAILDRYESGQAVDVLERGDGWTRVRHKLTQREGWIQAKWLRDEPPAGEKETVEQPKVSPSLSTAAIAKLLIAESIASYSGPCACPYQSARNGSSCGRRAAYVRPGGAAPLCYARDITPEMVAEYRTNH